MFTRPLICIGTADYHFGAMDPKVQYEILMEQMIKPLYNIQFDMFQINGDIFHHKFMANSDAVSYALLFVDEVVKLCISKNATLVMLHGTGSHDADQLKLFYRYINSGVDIRIIENMQFQNIKGLDVLCIPEEYGKGKEYYDNMLYHVQDYDMVLMHGNIKGAIYGMDKQDHDNPKAPVFDINSFARCKGPILAGHVHVNGCYQNHIYYSGSPLRWVFGEEQEKGFIVCMYDKATSQYCVEFQPIKSFRYDTIKLDDMIDLDPTVIIQHIMNLKSNGIDFLKVKFGSATSSTDAVKAYFATKQDITIDVCDSGFMNTIRENQSNNDKFAEYDYMIDSGMTEYDIFTRYVNQQEGREFITADELMSILSSVV